MESRLYPKLSSHDAQFAPFAKMPDDLHYQIFKHLDRKSLLQLSAISKNFRCADLVVHSFSSEYFHKFIQFAKIMKQDPAHESTKNFNKVLASGLVEGKSIPVDFALLRECIKYSEKFYQNLEPNYCQKALELLKNTKGQETIKALSLLGKTVKKLDQTKIEQIYSAVFKELKNTPDEKTLHGFLKSLPPLFLKQGLKFVKSLKDEDSLKTQSLITLGEKFLQEPSKKNIIKAVKCLKSALTIMKKNNTEMSMPKITALLQYFPQKEAEKLLKQIEKIISNKKEDFYACSNLKYGTSDMYRLFKINQGRIESLCGIYDFYKLHNMTEKATETATNIQNLCTLFMDLPAEYAFNAKYAMKVGETLAKEDKKLPMQFFKIAEENISKIKNPKSRAVLYSKLYKKVIKVDPDAAAEIYKASIESINAITNNIDRTHAISNLLVNNVLA